MPTRSTKQPEIAEVIDTAVKLFDVEKIEGIYVGATGVPLGLHARIAKITAALPDVTPQGENKHFNYKFISDKQVLGMLRPRLSEQMITIIPETVEERPEIPLETKSGGRSMLSRILVTWRVVDGINGESFTGQSLGYGDDSGDKGANKAYTAALKNFLIKLFLIGGDTDIESDEETDKRAKARSSGAQVVEQVVIGDSAIEGVKRGGRSTKGTETQINRIGQYVRDLRLDPGAVAALIMKVLDDHIELGEKPWEDVRSYFEAQTAEDLGKLVAKLDELNEAATATSEPDPDMGAH